VNIVDGESIKACLLLSVRWFAFLLLMVLPSWGLLLSVFPLVRIMLMVQR
jgi:hypothetical protein